jgi:hypothetical protein
MNTERLEIVLELRDGAFSLAPRPRANTDAARDNNNNNNEGDGQRGVGAVDASSAGGDESGQEAFFCVMPEYTGLSNSIRFPGSIDNQRLSYVFMHTLHAHFSCHTLHAHPSSTPFLRTLRSPLHHRCIPPFQSSPLPSHHLPSHHLPSHRPRKQVHLKPTPPFLHTPIPPHPSFRRYTSSLTEHCAPPFLKPTRECAADATTTSSGDATSPAHAAGQTQAERAYDRVADFTSGLMDQACECERVADFTDGFDPESCGCQVTRLDLT